MIKKILIGFCLFLSAVTWAQEGTSSPYSFYGIGDIKFKGTVENRSMGGVSVFNDSIHVNLQNPASFSHLKFTTFTVGANYNNVKLETESQSEKATRTTIDYLVVAMPISKKFGASLGLLPFSSVGYKIQNVNADPTQTSSRYFGEGGVNRLFGGLGYKFNDNFSIGADINYNFGNISTTAVDYIPEVQYGTRELNESRLNGVNYNFGMMYNRKVTEKLTVFGSLAYSPESNMNIDNERNITTVLVAANFNFVPQDEGITQLSTSKLKLPSKFVLGAGIGEVRKWAVGAELTMQQSSSFGNRFNDIDNVEYENSTKFSFGGYFIPKYNSFNKYLERVTYRAGFNYENTGLIINNKAINNYGITFGLGLPLGGSFSNINVGVEYGKRGTIYSGLVEENYTNIFISLSLNDRWFVKRKYE
ncbi:outer membrane protein transport protein [Flavobacterium azooxidireducens]|uniref:Outer membrane protein transport protein n=1 Tax=Flavobacterium azooxidireducens TaxID=1871076 RepID=A0ABY4KAG5_9FLAO|nr:outer membrane protein transport protein [Flavobacterium azooxidireducens]UPQ77787.1 outer membrane protein transport protein [Flavobacterium azooxidireducens]